LKIKTKGPSELHGVTAQNTVLFILRLSEKGELTRVFGPKREEVTGGRR
jgi:hypothetical protein